MNQLLTAGAAVMFLAVVLGAFGAHALKAKLSENQSKNYQTGVQYQIAHGLGLILLGTAGKQLGHASLVEWAGWLMLGGIVLFSGSLYVLSLSGIRRLGAVTPFGGLLMLAGWVLFAAAAAQG
ncbi:DUF423 domain-containing protein [Paenibacillus pinistramenti]|uniref:DUF423 domain-containing protein n=1 Tax=Paenibacillus pinistramenti TaxID=1768003 RepID=UPI0011088928|nr:DUF423 domain-containing protein [Paenibacillus pinistramenti]